MMTHLKMGLLIMDGLLISHFLPLPMFNQGRIIYLSYEGLCTGLVFWRVGSRHTEYGDSPNQPNNFYLNMGMHESCIVGSAQFFSFHLPTNKQQPTNQKTSQPTLLGGQLASKHDCLVLATRTEKILVNMLTVVH